MRRMMVQYFEWYLRPEDKLWESLKEDSRHLKSLGVSDVWMPPAYKGKKGINDSGYGVYDLYDMGEFVQKGTVATKYGSEASYAEAVNELHQVGIGVIADIVLNHKLGADDKEKIQVESVSVDARHEVIESLEIEGWTKFTFDNRKGRYSKFNWNQSHFTGVDYDALRDKSGLYRFKGKSWAEDVDLELQNYDYLMGADVDFSNEEVIQEYKTWGSWYTDKYDLNGLRLDAVKHISFDFFGPWLSYLRENRELFVVGEYWSSDLRALNNYLMMSDYAMHLFDVPLHFNLHEASVLGEAYDLRDIFKNTLVQNMGKHAVTFVDNHDTQVGQSLESYVKDWFRLSANAIILLREFGTPCVFYNDYKNEDVQKLMKLRSHISNDLYDRFDDPNVVGWSYVSDEGLCVLINNSNDALKKMFVGKHMAGQVFKDALGSCSEEVLISELGIGIFPVKARSVSVYTKGGHINESIS